MSKPTLPVGYRLRVTEGFDDDYLASTGGGRWQRHLTLQKYYPKREVRTRFLRRIKTIHAGWFNLRYEEVSYRTDIDSVKEEWTRDLLAEIEIEKRAYKLNIDDMRAL